MGHILKDLQGNWSSGALVKALAFLFALEFGLLALFMKADLTAVAAAVGALLGLVGAFQWAQSATADQPSELTNPAPLGVMQNSTGTQDLGRWIKFLAFLAGVVILHVVLIWKPDSLLQAVGLAGIFFTLATSQEIAQKATGT